jgi:hypothetical protein
VPTVSSPTTSTTADATHVGRSSRLVAVLVGAAVLVVGGLGWALWSLGLGGGTPQSAPPGEAGEVVADEPADEPADVLWSESFSPPGSDDPDDDPSGAGEPGGGTPEDGSAARAPWEERSGVVVASRTGAEVVEEGPEGREGVLEVPFESGSRWGIDYRHSFEALGIEPREEVRYAYDVYFPEDFEFLGDGKFGGLAGTTEGLDPLETSSGGDYDERSFSVRAMWREDRSVVMYLYARHGAGRDIDDPDNFGFGITVPFTKPDGSTDDVIVPGTWQRVEHRVTLNTPGEDDGTYEMWIDGHRGVQVTDVQYRTEEYPDIRVDQVFTAWFFGGGADQFPTRENVAWTDEWVLSAPSRG